MLLLLGWVSYVLECSTWLCMSIFCQTRGHPHSKNPRTQPTYPCPEQMCFLSARSHERCQNRYKLAMPRCFSIHEIISKCRTTTQLVYDLGEEGIPHNLRQEWSSLECTFSYKFAYSIYIKLKTSEITSEVITEDICHRIWITLSAGPRQVA